MGKQPASPIPAVRLDEKVELPTVRIEALRLAHRHDLPAKAVIERAAELEAYVLNGRPAEPEGR
jgi:hypothetical protein